MMQFVNFKFGCIVKWRSLYQNETNIDVKLAVWLYYMQLLVLLWNV